MPYLLKQIFVFITGFFIGIILAVIVFHNDDYKQNIELDVPSNFVSEKQLYDAWFEKSGLLKKPVNLDEISFSKSNLQVKTESEYLFRNVSVICVIFVKNDKNAYAVSNSWGKKCNKIHFFGEKDNRYLQFRKFKSVSSWTTLCHSIRYIWREYRNSISWVLFSPDNLFVIPENLRYFVAPKNYLKPHYIGRKYLFWNQIYNKAEAGIILSLGTIKLLTKKFDSFDACESSIKYSGNEDYYMGKFLSELGVAAMDARDEEGKERLHMFTPEQLMSPRSPEVLSKYSKYSVTPVVQGWNCCSPTSISFQGTQKDLIFFYSYLLYNIKTFNKGDRGNRFSDKHSSYDHVWKKFVETELGVGVDFRLVSAEDYFKLWSSKISSPEEFNDRLKSILQFKGVT